MRQAGRWLFGLLFALLIFLGAQTLVEGPEEKEFAPVPVPSENACLVSAMAAADIPSGACVADRDEHTRQYAARSCIRAQIPAVTPQCESNGWPLTSRSWVRTVYPSCPLENKAG